MVDGNGSDGSSEVNSVIGASAVVTGPNAVVGGNKSEGGSHKSEEKAAVPDNESDKSGDMHMGGDDDGSSVQSIV